MISCQSLIVCALKLLFIANLITTFWQLIRCCMSCLLRISVSGLHRCTAGEWWRQRSSACFCFCCCWCWLWSWWSAVQSGERCRDCSSSCAVVVQVCQGSHQLYWQTDKYLWVHLHYNSLLFHLVFSAHGALGVSYDKWAQKRILEVCPVLL